MRKMVAGNVVFIEGTLYRFTSEKKLQVGSVILDNNLNVIYTIETEEEVTEYQKKYDYTLLEPLSICAIEQEECKCQRL